MIQCFIIVPILLFFYCLIEIINPEIFWPIAEFNQKSKGIENPKITPEYKMMTRLKAIWGLIVSVVMIIALSTIGF